MSQDPFQEREAEKYANPIPSREFILEHLTKREKPASREELAVELNIEGEEQLEALRRRLRAMERDGQLVFTRRQCYALPERLDLLKGTVIGHRDGYGFLRVEGRKDDLYLSSEQMKTCIHGDQVLAQPLGADRKGRREARIVRVLVPKTSQIVGRYFTDAGVGFVVPDDSRLSFDFVVVNQLEVVIFHHFFQFFSEGFFVEKVTNTQTATCHFIFISRPDSTTGGADRFRATRFLTRVIQRNVIIKDQRTGFRQQQTLTNGDATVFQFFHLFHQRARRQHNTVTDDAGYILAKNT